LLWSLRKKEGKKKNQKRESHLKRNLGCRLRKGSNEGSQKGGKKRGDREGKGRTRGKLSEMQGRNFRTTRMKGESSRRKKSGMRGKEKKERGCPTRRGRVLRGRGVLKGEGLSEKGKRGRRKGASGRCRGRCGGILTLRKERLGEKKNLMGGTFRGKGRKGGGFNP